MTTRVKDFSDSRFYTDRVNEWLEEMEKTKVVVIRSTQYIKYTGKLLVFYDETPKPQKPIENKTTNKENTRFIDMDLI